MTRSTASRLMLLVLAAGLLAPTGQAQRGPKKRGPKVGEKAPDFELKHLDAKATFKLSDNFGKRPTVLNGYGGSRRDGSRSPIPEEAIIERVARRPAGEATRGRQARQYRRPHLESERR